VYVQDILADGYSASQIITQVFDQLVTRTGINDQQKSEVAERLAVSTLNNIHIFSTCKNNGNKKICDYGFCFFVVHSLLIRG